MNTERLKNILENPNEPIKEIEEFLDNNWGKIVRNKRTELTKIQKIVLVFSYLASNDSILLEFIVSETKNISNDNLKERLYSLLSKEGPLCPLNKYRNFRNTREGYRNCNKNCACAIKQKETTNIKKYGVSHSAKNLEIKEKTRQTNLNKSDEQKEISLFKRKQTNLEKYGVEHPAASAQIKEKTKQFNLNKYGVEHPSLLEEVNKKRKITNIQRYGHVAAHTEQNIQQAKKTNLERYGCENPMSNSVVREKIYSTNLKLYGHVAGHSPENLRKMQETNLERYGSIWSVNSVNNRDKSKETNLKRYGCDNPLSNSDIIKKRTETNLERYGCENPMLNSVVRAKATQTFINNYGTPTPAQKNYSKEIYNLLSNSDEFADFMLDKSVPTASELLNIDQSTVYAYCHKYKINFSFPISSYETAIADFLKKHGIDFIHGSFKIIPPLQLDFYLPEYNVAIEFNGLYYHSDKFKDKNYHYDKWKTCNSVGIRLLMINEDEWNKYSESIKRKILNVCGKSEKGVGARKLNIKVIPLQDGQDFCETFHIQGKTATVKYAYGAFNCDTLVAAMLFNQQRNTQNLELIRFCTDGKTYAGLFSKMFSKFVKDHPEENKVLSFADLRYSDGNLYRKCGFDEVSVALPDYRYIKGGITFHKSSLQKKQIAKKFDLDWDTEVNPRTERELTEALGFSRIYDCGKIKFIWTR